MPDFPTAQLDPIAARPIAARPLAGLQPVADMDTAMPPVNYGVNPSREPIKTVDSPRREPVRELVNDVKLVYLDDGSYAVTITDGVLCEHLLSADLNENAIIYHRCPSRLDDDGYPREFPIQLDEAIFILALVDEYGQINIPEGDEEHAEPVDLAVADKDTKSLNHIPDKQAGIYYYKLAELVEEDGAPVLKHYLSGSHIHHVSGITADSMLVGCDGDPLANPPVEPTMIQRHSFMRGVLVALDAAKVDRPLATIRSVKTVSRCCEPT